MKNMNSEVGVFVEYFIISVNMGWGPIWINTVHVYNTSFDIKKIIYA